MTPWLLVAGDLFDQDGVDTGTLAFALGAFDVAGCPPVFIAPGNHDPYFEGSLYWDARLLQARAMRWRPRNLPRPSGRAPLAMWPKPLRLCLRSR